MNRGRFLREIVSLSFCHPHRNQTETFCSKTSFHSRCRVSYENCKRQRRNYTLKCENCFAILISVCNFHISLQFSYQFAILTFRCIVPTWTFTIFIWVCNFPMSLQFSYQFAILMSPRPALTYMALHGFYVTMEILFFSPWAFWPAPHYCPST